MSSKKRGLGKGLNELLSATLGTPFASPGVTAPMVAETPTPSSSIALSYLPVEKLSGSAFQPRQHIAHDGLEQLAESIRAQGILQPIVVRAKKEGYEIIAGERRWRAAQLAGLPTVPAIVRDLSDEAAMAIAVIENIQRENLNPLEEAQAFKRLSELGLTHLQVAEAVGKSRASITNCLRLLTLNGDVQQLVEQGQLEMGHARALLGLKGEQQSQVAQTVVAKSLSVRQTEEWVSQLQKEEIKQEQEEKLSEAPRSIDPNIRKLENDLSDKLGASVLIRHGAKGKGALVIRYHSVDELEGILAHFDR